MKGVKVAEFANASSRKFQSDNILATKIHMPEGIEVFESLKKLVVDNQKMISQMKILSEENAAVLAVNIQLTVKITNMETILKELSEKVNTFEIAE